ncbi:MAG: oligosaccharide flippase family protein [Sphingomonas sp.]|nr:oligosaccharide flippase family protein [Sphingomonas sp.]
MKREFTIAAAWSAAGAWIEQGVAAVNFLVIARLVGVEDFGIAAMAFAFLFLGEFLVRDTLTEAIVERSSLEEGRLEATFVALIGFSIVVVLALAAIAYVAARAYGQPAVAPLLLVASPTVLMIGAAGVPTALLRRKLAYRTLAVRSVLGVVAGGLVGITMAINGFGAWSLVGQRLTDIGINSVMAFTAAGWVPRRWPKLGDYAMLSGLGPRVVLLRSLTLVIVQTPTVALGIFAGPRAAGLFAFASRLVEIVGSLIVQPVQGVAQSTISEMRRQHSSTHEFFLDLTNMAGWISFPAFVGLALIADPLVSFLLGNDWRAAGPMLAILCVPGATAALTAIQEAYLLAMDRIEKFVRASAIEAAIGVVIVALGSFYGPLAAVGGVALRALAAFPLRTSAALNLEGIGWRRFGVALIPPLLASGSMAVPLAIWRTTVLGRVPDLLYVVSATAMGMGCVAGVLFALMPKELARLRSFIHPNPSPSTIGSRQRSRSVGGAHHTRSHRP